MRTTLRTTPRTTPRVNATQRPRPTPASPRGAQIELHRSMLRFGARFAKLEEARAWEKWLELVDRRHYRRQNPAAWQKVRSHRRRGSFLWRLLMYLYQAEKSFSDRRAALRACGRLDPPPPTPHMLALPTRWPSAHLEMCPHAVPSAAIPHWPRRATPMLSLRPSNASTYSPRLAYALLCAEPPTHCFAPWLAMAGLSRRQARARGISDDPRGLYPRLRLSSPLGARSVSCAGTRELSPFPTRGRARSAPKPTAQRVELPHFL